MAALTPSPAKLAKESGQPAGYSLNLDPPGMAADLAQLPATVSVPEGFTIRQVEDLDTLHTWARVFVAGYGAPESMRVSYHRLMASLRTNLPLRHYLGYLNGEPVTAASLFLREGLPGSITWPRCRRRGARGWERRSRSGRCWMHARWGLKSGRCSRRR